MTKDVRYEPKPMSAEQARRLDALADLPDDRIDFSDAPATTAEDWEGAEVGRFYRPLKQQLTLRLDADLVEWFRRRSPDGKGYQTAINRALREYVDAASRKAG